MVHELDLVHRALRTLAESDRNWGSNLFVFEGMTDTGRATWWLRAQAQAERLERQQDVGEDDRGVDAETLDALRALGYVE